MGQMIVILSIVTQYVLYQPSSGEFCVACRLLFKGASGASIGLNCSKKIRLEKGQT